jgi:hypothetical protein
MTQTTPVDLYSLPEEIVVRFWKNFEDSVRTMQDTAKKHAFVDLVLNEPCARERIFSAFVWSYTPEGLEYWKSLYEGKYSK